MKEQILRLEQGFPQNWIYIERKVKNRLKSENLEGVKASQNFIGKTITDIFHQDILNIYNQKVTKIRPIIGANGAGKTTLLKFHVVDFLDELSPNANLVIFFDFKAVTDDIDEFWSIFIQKLIEQLVPEEGENIISKIINQLDPARRSFALLKIFKDKVIVDNLIKLSSVDPNVQFSALEYFYGESLETKKISDFFYGILKLALQLNYFVVVAFDEIQFLNEIDKSNVLLKIFLEKFVRYLMEQFSNERLFILISSLENPKEKEWTELKSRSRNFETIVNGKEIYLGNLTLDEKNAIIQQVADKIGFDQEHQKIFFSRVKSSLLYYLPRDLLKCIANVIDSMGYIGYSDYEIRKIYEEDARNYMKPFLNNKGFIYLEPEEKKIGGYDVDIFATAETNRAGYVKKAFGEVTMMQKSNMKQKVEKFANWLFRMKGREYNPEKGDYAFFVCPPNSLTRGSREVLESNNIEIFPYISQNIEQLQGFGKTEEEIVCEVSEEQEIKTEIKAEPEITFIKEEKYKLEDIPGIGPKKASALKKAGILTIKDLLNCNVKMKAKEIAGVGEASLNKWRQNARQILSD